MISLRVLLVEDRLVFNNGNNQFFTDTNLMLDKTIFLNNVFFKYILQLII